MKTTALKLALISACFAFTLTACNANRRDNGDADTDTMMTDTAGMTTDTMMMDTSGTRTDTGIRRDTGTGTGTPPTP